MKTTGTRNPAALASCSGWLGRALVALLLGGCFAPSALMALVTIDTGIFPACQPARPGEVGPEGFTCEDLFISSFDGTRLDATLYVPDSASPATPAPAILMTHGGFNWHRRANSPISGDIPAQRFLAAQGYVVLAWTMRGEGRSGGHSDDALSPEHAVRDARTLITWLARAENTGGAVLLDGPDDPRIGMFGGSQAGAIQLLTASRDLRIDAITPQITWHDLTYSLAPNGVIKYGWETLLLMALRTHSNHLGSFEYFNGRILPPVVSTRTSPTLYLHTLMNYVANDEVELPIRRDDGSRSNTEFLRRRSPIFDDVIDDLRAPTLLIHGQKDTLIWLNEALANARAIAKNQVPTKVVVYSGGHVWTDLPGERDEINERALTWFDRYLRGNLAADTGSPVEVWRPWIPGTNFADLPAFPEAETDAGVSPDSALLVNVPAPTSHSEIPIFQEPFAVASPSVDLAPGATAVDLETSVPEGTAIAGIPILRFTVTATAIEGILFAKLWDEGPSGERILIHHLVTPVRVRGGKGDFCSDTAAGPLSSTLVANVEVCLPLAGIVWKVEPGHRLVLALATSDTMYFGSRYPAVYEITNVSLELPEAGL